MEYEVKSVRDKYNANKLWVYKHYKDGHYMLNQYIVSRRGVNRVYGAFRRVTKKRMAEIGII